MNDGQPLDKTPLLDWSRQVQEILCSKGDQAGVQAVEQARTAFATDRFVLAILGKAKRGKSTLLNALLGQKDGTAAPIDKLPASSAISRFRWAEKQQAIVHFRQGNEQEIPFSQIRSYVTEELNKQNHKQVDVVQIQGPFPGLDKDLELVDTPGAASIHEHHDALLHAFIPQADAVIFLVTARMPLDQDELDLLQKVKSADIRKIFFAINRVDESSPQDIQAAIEHNTHLLAQAGVQVGQIHQISAKRAFQGDLSGSGVPELMGEIAEFLSREKGRALCGRLVSRVCQAAAPVFQGLEVQLSSSSKSAQELDLEIKDLRQRKVAIESERSLAERQFKLAWSKAMDQYEQGLKQAKSTILNQVQGRIQKTALTEASTLARKLPTYLNQSLDEHLQPVARSFEQQVREACDQLQATYPALEVGNKGELVIGVREGNLKFSGSAGGIAMAATGAGLALAGGTAAAGIAAANAAAAAATATVAAPSLIATLGSSLGSLLGSLGVPYASAAGSILGAAGTGTATVAAPAAFTATPLWVALAGPVGWTLAGIGVLAVPFSWRLSKIKLLSKLEEASTEQIQKVFGRLENERLPAIRKMGETILQEIRLNLDRQLQQIEAAMIAARDKRPSAAEAQVLSLLTRQLGRLLELGLLGNLLPDSK